MTKRDGARLVIDLVGAVAALFLLGGWIQADWISGQWLVLYLALVLLLAAPVRLHATLWGIRVAGPVIGGLAAVFGVLIVAFGVGVFVWELYWTDLDRVMSVRGDEILPSFALGCLLLLKVYCGFRRRAR